MSDWVMPLALLKSSPHMILGTKECVCSWYIVSDSSSSASRQRYRWVVIARSYCHKTQLISLLSRTASDFDYDLLQHQMRSRNHHKNPLAHSVWKCLKIVTLEFRAFSNVFFCQSSHHSTADFYQRSPKTRFTPVSSLRSHFCEIRLFEVFSNTVFYLILKSFDNDF